MFSRLILRIKDFVWAAERSIDDCLSSIYALWMPMLVARVRKRKSIRVTFVVADLGAWKTENLYWSMTKHDRFEPSIVVVPVLEDPAAKDVLVAYLREKSIPFFELGKADRLSKVVKSDIIFYQKPYHSIYYRSHRFSRNLGSLFCFVQYGLRSIVTKIQYDTPMLNAAWQVYFENEGCVEGPRLIMRNKSRNAYVTGSTTQDELIDAMNCSPDPWQCRGVKRIIYAPHHTIPQEAGWLAYSTFLDYADFMLQLAEKYKDRVAFAFKPHPLLEAKLKKYWGEEKTAAYYSAWEKIGQLERGKYYGLFAHSDAMIHDCSSFTLEYIYAHKPVLYLAEDDQKHCENLNSMSVRAYNLHYKGRCKEDIERFVLDVIEGHDALAEEREAFYQEELLPPYGKSACQNIVNAILGEGEFVGK